MEDLDIIDMDALLMKPVGRVKCFGQVHDVLPTSGATQDLLAQLAARGPDNSGGLTVVQLGRAMIEQLVPSMTAGDRAKLAVDQIELIVAISTRQVDKVKAMIGIAEGNGPGEAPPKPPKSPGRKSTSP